MEYALEAEGINKSFGGVKALVDVDLKVSPGEVLCLAGANGSGKSTIIKIISGVERADTGTIRVNGQPLPPGSAIDAVKAGIQVIFQDMSLFPNLTVAENIAISSRVANRSRTVTQKEALALARSIADQLGVKLDLDARVGDVSVADRQLVAICRALALDVKVLFMDEPTTALTWTEIQSLVRIVNGLRKRGVAIVFVSHKTEEVFMVSDRIEVLRNGKMVVEGPTGTFTPNSLIEALLGYLPNEDRIVSDLNPAAGEIPALRVTGLGVQDLFADVSFDVRKGEIVGLTGLLGSGRSEIAESIFGILPSDSGQIEVDGTRTVVRSVRDAIGAGIAYVPEDRLTEGIVLDQSIGVNLVSAALEKTAGFAGVLKPTAMKTATTDLVDRFAIKTDDPANPVSSLSGGNQQRVVLGKWMFTDPKVLILNGPTVGVDAGSKAAILQLLRDSASAGVGILVISDDLPELVSVCHRVLIVKRGRLVDEIAQEAISEEYVRERIYA
ncbi:sugar ABC transporter ATP-binding protein [Propionimicrobium sp. PCR01-08-3]|uniref:sugar ABC transporter ATP-binding protein n=1 Tax=Propionimicrobium sp. PCR01-08-3 TaxID=3052086 RepID=UPI00255C9EF2|nr:sugar ABC transporter ATP-binding protein [Propionimicrobium sp. PCR01-08-3]WIY83960.1 sugar ABC transporter ATP-binding protein [Propionimicrobium sp. PCR01-08-3]